jgi:hypothetical protein
VELSVFGMPVDITLAVEAFYPADEETREFLRQG